MSVHLHTSERVVSFAVLIEHLDAHLQCQYSLPKERVKVNIPNTPNILYICKLYYLVHELLQTLYILKRSKCAAITIYSVIIVLLMLRHRHWNF